jgi:hypothetical protein
MLTRQLFLACNILAIHIFLSRSKLRLEVSRQRFLRQPLFCFGSARLRIRSF